MSNLAAAELTNQINAAFALKESSGELSPQLYVAIVAELRRRARQQLQGLPPQEAETGVLHEAIAKLLGSDLKPFDSREDFYNFASAAVRNLALDAIRTAGRQKRGGHLQIISLAALPELDVAGQSAAKQEQLVSNLIEALDGLQASHCELHRIVTMNFFLGFSRKEIAQALQMSLSKVDRSLKTSYGVLRLSLRAGE